MIKDKELVKIFNNLVKVNKKALQGQKSFCPVCFVIDKKYHIKVFMMAFKGSMAKQEMRNMIHGLILSQKDTIGYIIGMDSKMSKIDMDTKEVEVFDALIHSLFTPKGSITHSAIYNEKKEFTEETQVDDIVDSVWNVWSMVKPRPDKKEIEDFYDDFKKKNPEKYKGVMD